MTPCSYFPDGSASSSRSSVVLTPALYILTFTPMSFSCDEIHTYTCHAFLVLYSLYALGRPGVLGINPVFGEREDEHVGLYQGDVDS